MIVKVKRRMAEVKVINQKTEEVRTVTVGLGSKCSATVAAIKRKRAVELKDDEIIFAVKELDKVIKSFECEISDDGQTLTGSLVNGENYTDTDSVE